MAAVWDDLVGQRRVVDALRRAAGGHGMTHAWLFTGPPGSGRSNAAKAFAAALQCEGDGDPGCGTCKGCHTTLKGSHADVTVVRTEKLSIGVDEVRDLVRRSALAPVGRRWQVRACLCWPVLRSRTRASKRCWTPWSITCRRLWIALR